MKYRVQQTDYAIAQVRDIITYISKTLLAPESAAHWITRFRTEIADLAFMPNRYPMVDWEPWKSRGVRKLTVGNFIVYYFVREQTKTVLVISVVNARRDQLAALRQMPKKEVWKMS